MLPFILGGVLTVAVGAVYYMRQKRRQDLEERQLQMFIEQLVWSPEREEYISTSRERIRPLKCE